MFDNVISDFLCIRCMQRKSRSHGTYKKFIREVRVAYFIVTHNVRTQTGKKWTATKQRKFVPHDQNQFKMLSIRL